MATVFKTFLNDDIASTRTLLHEAIPLKLKIEEMEKAVQDFQEEYVMKDI